MLLLSLFVHFACACILSWQANWLGLVSWRRAVDQHWTERARLLWPVRNTAALSVFVMPLLLDQIHRFLWPGTAGWWLPNGLASLLGTALGTFSCDHEVLPKVRFRGWLVEVGIAWCVGDGALFALIAAIVVMPKTFGWATVGVSGVYLAFHFALQWGLDRKCLRAIGLLTSASRELRELVERMCAQTGTPRPRNIWVSQGLLAQAYAFRTTGEMAFSQRLLDICPEEEVSAVCAHELAHLRESRSALACRLLSSLTPFPLIFLKPFFEVSAFGIIVPILSVSALVRFTHWFSLRMEKRADQKACAEVENSGVYARALERMYKENQTPAVNADDYETHPHLYDRMVAAGITPDYPRPQRPRNYTWVGVVHLVVLGLLVVVNCIV